MAALLTLITLTAFEFFINRPYIRGLAMIPYIAWVTFASGLNFFHFQKQLITKKERPFIILRSAPF
ncbi:tryptophan-rich sensory protein [Peribacillus frigoritolerans]|nr:tryptophan-rich sensory protein [Peribacillus frigoritolerans]